MCIHIYIYIWVHGPVREASILVNMGAPTRHHASSAWPAKADQDRLGVWDSEYIGSTSIATKTLPVQKRCLDRNQQGARKGRTYVVT